MYSNLPFKNHKSFKILIFPDLLEYNWQKDTYDENLVFWYMYTLEMISTIKLINTHHLTYFVILCAYGKNL